MLDKWLSIVSEYRLIAVIRPDKFEQKALIAAEVMIKKAGVKLIEITWNGMQSYHLIQHLRKEHPHCYIGVGTILSIEDLKTALNAQIQFAFSPHFAPELIDLAHNHNIPFTPGALTPTEIIKAHDYGVKTVKVFPIQSVGGVDYVKNVLAPTPHLKLIPTGGITINKAQDYIKSGAVGIGLSTDLFPPNLVANNLWDDIAGRVKQIQNQLQQIN